LVSAKAATTASSSSSTSSSSSSSSSTTSKSGSGSTTPSESGGGTPTKPSKPSTPRIVIHFHVTAQFGVVPPPAPGAAPLPTQLKSYENMTVDQPLPDKLNPQVVFLGVLLPTGKAAVFALL